MLKTTQTKTTAAKNGPTAEAQTLRVSHLSKVFGVNYLQSLQCDQTVGNHFIQCRKEFLDFFLRIDDLNNHR